MNPTQEKKELSGTFLARTDALAEKMRLNVEDLTEVLGVSRSSLFGWRKGRRKVSNKAWAILEQAERDAGIEEGLEVNKKLPKPKQEKDTADKLLQLMDELGLDNEAKSVIAGAVLRNTLDQWRDEVHEFWLDSGALAHLAKDALPFLSGELKKEVEFFTVKVLDSERSAIEALDKMHQTFSEVLGEESEKEDLAISLQAPGKASEAG